MPKKLKLLLYIVFFIYILTVLKLTIFRDDSIVQRQLNLTFLIDLIKAYQTLSLWQFLRLFLGNIGWFVPFGLFVPILFRQENIFKVALFGLIFSFSIEVLQFILKKGISEVDDLILNTIGTVIGFGIYNLIKKFL